MPDISTSLPPRRRAPVLLAALAGAVIAASAIGVPAPAVAAGAASVTVANASGTAVADPDVATTFTVTATGFQSITGGFGGVYALFGWIDPAGSGWKPSEGGSSGTDYRYVPDQESKDNGGFQRFIAFPGSETEGAANAVMTATGDWSVEMVVPGSEFQSLDRSGGVSAVDCLTAQCGIITIGAHGVKNANNETFTPISFAAPAAPAAIAGATDATGAAGAAGTSGIAATGAAAARVGYTTATATAGNALSFTGQGFVAGEQVVATLDDGVSAVGPLTAGPAGDVAGVLQLPPGLRAGTHLLTLNGAASAAVAQAEVTVAADPDSAAAPVAESAEPAWPYLALGVGILVAAVLLLLSIITSIVRGSRARRLRRAAANAIPATPAAAHLDGSAAPTSPPRADAKRVDRVAVASPEAPTERLVAIGYKEPTR